MQLKIKKRIFSVADTFDITDDEDIPLYQVHGKFFTISQQLELTDVEGNVLAKIHQRIFSPVSEYDILRDDQIIAVVKQSFFAIVKERFTVNGPDGSYEIEGDWLNWSYEIRKDGQKVARIKHEFSVFQDQYFIDIVEGSDVPLLICLAIVIDEVSHPKD